MKQSEPVPFAVGDVVRLKKPHPCGGYDWTVVRLGADIGVKCLRCGRRVLLPRRDLERRLKQFLEREPGGDPAAGPHPNSARNPHPNPAPPQAPLRRRGESPWGAGRGACGRGDARP